MGLFDKLTDTDDLTPTTDSLGGDFSTIPSDVYEATLKTVYAGQSQRGAQNLTIIYEANDREISEVIYFTNKDGENFYKNKQDPKKKSPLPGFTTVNDLCLLATGFPLKEQKSETKTVKVWDWESRKEIPKPVECLTALHGKAIDLGVLEICENKQKANDQGVYVPTAETRMKNEINKIFHSDTKCTVLELRNGIEKGEVITTWRDRNQGKMRDNSKKVTESTNATGAAGSGRPEPKSLFGAQ